MDPNATVRLILEAICDGDMGEADYLRRELVAWVKSGGFEPSDFPNWRTLINGLTAR